MDTQTSSSETRLSFFKDWLFSCRMAATALVGHPYYALLVIVCALVVSTVPERSLAAKLVPYIAQAAIMALGTYVVFTTYGAMRPTESARLVDHKFQRRIITIGGLYWFAVSILSLLLVAPGIYAAIKGCMAMQIACIEGTGVTESINRSFDLVKGHFRKIIWYLGLAPLVPIGISLGACYLLFYLGVTYIPVPESLSDSSAEYIADAVFSFPTCLISSFIELSIFALMTKFYVYLISQTNIEDQVAATPSPTPKWDP